ncbi:MAG: VCBS repeat-containing protein [candidate division Zixibacteria bacterium]|nr:VCBS repeat-containing protein [candidate division Zixibacteria bacterium]
MPASKLAPPKLLLFLLLACLLTFLTTSAGANTIRVPYDMPSIPSAIGSASDGDTVLVYPGTYVVQLNFLGKDIVVISFGGPSGTTLMPPDDAIPLVRFINGETDAAVLSGFTCTGTVNAAVLYISASSPTITDNRFTDHYGLSQDHAVIRVTGDAHPNIHHNLFYDNPDAWGVIWSNADSIMVTNNTIAVADRGMVIYSVNSIVKNNIVTGCSVYGFYNNLLSMTRQYNDIWNNTVNYYGGMTADSTDLSVDPLFVDTAEADYALQWGSPCLDAGDPGAEYTDPDGTRNDIGAFYYDQTPPHLLAYEPPLHAANVPADVNVTMTFDMPMDPATVADSTVFVYSACLGRPVGMYGYDPDLMRAAFTPDPPLPPGDRIRVIVSDAVRSERHIPLTASYAWAFTIAVGGGYGHFIADSAYTVGTNPYAVAAADFDGDHDIDLAAADYGANTVTLLDNLGDGTFQAGGTCGVNNGPIALAAADIDADGSPDLVTADWVTNTVSVVRNNGDGTFVSDVNHAVGISPGALTVADFNRDGYQDIATANASSDNVSILMNNGDGTFAAHVTYPVNNYPRGITSADLDRDGDIDLITTNRDPDKISVLRNIGDGTFAAKMTYTVGTRPHSVYAADLDGDGDIDLAVENELSDNVSILKNNGNATFASHVLYAVGDAPYGTCGGDFDGDGDIDLAVANSGSDDIAVLLNHGDATFAPYISCPVLGDMPNAVASADFDGDGALDLASADRLTPYTVTVLRNLPIANHAPVLNVIGPKTVEEGQSLDFEITAVDPDEDQLFMTVENSPPGAQFSDHGDGTASFDWNVAYGLVGSYPVWFIVSDSDLADSELVEITITPAPPEIGGLTIDGAFPAGHVIDQTPCIAWEYIDPGNDDVQMSFEMQVGTDDDWSVAEMWDPGEMLATDTETVYAGAALQDGVVYHLRLRVRHALAASEWYAAVFRMNTAPTMPLPMHPAGNIIIASDMPILFLTNATDAENDFRRYDFEIYQDSTAPGPLYAAEGIIEQADSTGWSVSPALAENQAYCWRGRCFDEYEYSSWSPFAAFMINAVEEPPQQFLVVEPGYSGLIIHNLLPEFSWLEAVEFDPGDSVYYTLQIATDSTFSFLQTVDSIWNTSHQLTGGLLYNTAYWWRVKATDNTGRSTLSTNTLTFRTWRLGDANNDWSVNLLDLLFLIDYLYNSPPGPAPNPLKTGDADADCRINLLDILYLIDYLYGMPPGPEPLVGCE